MLNKKSEILKKVYEDKLLEEINEDREKHGKKPIKNDMLLFVTYHFVNNLRRIISILQFYFTKYAFTFLKILSSKRFTN